MGGISKANKIIRTMLLPFVVALMNLLIIFFPKDSIAGAREGIVLWFENVLPALLPFLIGTNLMLSLGFVNFVGVLLEPVMHTVFDVPGCGGFAMAVGFLSGYPMGAKLTAELAERGEITKDEGERLLSFVNNSGPLFILGAVSAGMFASVHAGYFLICVHYLAAVTSGILFKCFYWSSQTRTNVTIGGDPDSHHLFSKACRTLIESNRHDPRPFGAKLGSSVAKSIETVLQIGGFITLFCVIFKVLDKTNIFDFLEFYVKPIFSFFRIPPELIRGVLIGTLEITNGIKTLSDVGLTKHVLIATAAIVSWGGFSIHAQSLSFISNTSLNPGVYLAGKLLNAILAVVYGILAYPIFASKISVIEAALAANIYKDNILDKIIRSSLFFCATVVLVILMAFITSVIRKIVSNNKKYKILK